MLELQETPVLHPRRACLPRAAVESLLFTLGPTGEAGPRMSACGDAVLLNRRGCRSHSFWSNSGFQQNGRQINFSIIILEKGGRNNGIYLIGVMRLKVVISCKILRTEPSNY